MDVVHQCSHRPAVVDTIHCSPTHRPALMDNVHCSPTHRPGIVDALLYSPTHRRKLKDIVHAPSARMLETGESPHCSPMHRYGPVDVLSYTPYTMTDTMITFHCPQSNVSNMPDITENLNDSNRPEQCRSLQERDTTELSDSSPEPRATIVHTCKTANAAVQVDLIPQSFYEGRSSIRWC